VFVRPKYLSLEALSPLYTCLGFFCLFFIFFLFFCSFVGVFVPNSSLYFLLSVYVFFAFFQRTCRFRDVFATFGWVLI